MSNFIKTKSSNQDLSDDEPENTSEGTLNAEKDDGNMDGASQQIVESSGTVSGKQKKTTKSIHTETENRSCVTI